MKKWCLLLIFALPIVFLGGQLLYLYTHREFTPNQFKCWLVRENTVDIPSITDQDKSEAQKILTQPFSFLGLGKQMTAYESHDHQYVLKLFNPRSRLKEKWFHDYKKLKFFCSMKWFSSAYFKRKERLLKLFNRHAVAYKEMKEEAGLVYVHLNPATAINQSVKIIDKDGTHFVVNLQDVPFVLQRKAELAGARLRTLAEQHNQKGIQDAYEQIRRLFWMRSCKGITDRVQTLHNNYGFLESGQAIQIDLGRIVYSKAVQTNPIEEVDKIMSQFQH